MFTHDAPNAVHHNCSCTSTNVQRRLPAGQAQAPQAASAALKLQRCSVLPAKIIGNPQAAYERHMPRNFQERNPALNTSADDWKPFLERFVLLDA